MLWFIFCLAITGSTATTTTTIGQTLPTACTPVSPATCVAGATCANKGCCISGSPSASCAGCATCCRVANPPFSKQCALNTVLILDNTASLNPYCSSVKPAVASFVNGLNNIVNAGGSVKLGVLLFKENPYIVWDMTQVTAPFLTSVQNWVGTASTNGNTVTGVFPSGTQVGGYCTNTGYTNWAAALYLAAQWPWNGVPVDIFIWFTDGFPEYSSSYFPQTQCASTCYANNNAYFSDICSASAPCTLGCPNAGGQYVTPNCKTGLTCVSDSGGSTGGAPGNAEGTWSACSAADALKATGVKLFLVGVGLVQGHENEIQLVTGTHAWDGTPANFGTSDYIVSASFSSLAQLFLETILGLCACLQAQPACAPAGASCNAIAFTAITRITTTAADTSTTIPPLSVVVATLYYDYQPSPNTRIAWGFYPIGDDVTQPTPVTTVRTDLQLPCLVQRQVTCSGGGGCIQITETKLIPRFFHESTDTAGCVAGPSAGFPTCTCFTKHYASPPFGAQVPEMVQYIWVLSADLVTPCGAQAYDGTLYEFFSTPAPTVGVTLGVPVMPVQQSSTCAVAQCGSNVELVFVLDQQSACTNADWVAINYFTLGIISSFPVVKATRFGIVYAGSAVSTWPTSALISASLGTWQNYLGKPPSTPPAHIPIGGTATDFAAAINLALTTFWPASTPATGVKRELLTYVCGPSSSSAAALATMKTNLGAANVEYWTVGVDQGTTSVTTLASLSATNNYVHYIAVPLAAALPNQQTLENQLLCPQTNLCGVDCLGLCTCGASAVLVCSCPVCSGTFCNPAACPDPSTGCLTHAYQCNDNSLCSVDSCNVNTQACVYAPITCASGNVCTTDSCNPGTGCVYTPVLCTDNDACTQDSCVGPSQGCTYTPIVCNDASACTQDSCSKSSGCVYTPITCSSGNACLSSSCNSQTGCVYTPISCVSPDPCKTSSCSPINGCIYTEIPCDDGNICTVDYCAGGACVYAPIAGCTLCATQCGAVTANGCQAKGCIESGNTSTTWVAARLACGAVSNYATGFSAANCIAALSSFAPPTVYCFLQDVSSSVCPSTSCETNSCSAAGPVATCHPVPVVCSDGLLCTVDSCFNPGGCSYVPINCPADACNTNGCNATTGACNPQPISCDDLDPCSVDTCVLPGGCIHTPIVCKGDACNTNACVGGQCVPTPIVCDDSQLCTVDTCSLSTGCVYTPIVCQQVASCFPTTCQAGVCVTSATPTPCAQQPTPCTSIECRQGVGCVPVNKTCSSTTECNFPVGCDNAQGGACILANITSLIDFCGVCLGDSASCFFSSVYPVSNIAGIAGGAVAGIVIACIIAALLIAWFTRKGYAYWRAQGDLSAQGLHDNPAFQQNNMSGENAAQ